MRIPDGVPMLLPGAHRKPSKGACFMEFASYLAGEPWSDHPDCTHPVLGALAREVNDHVGDGSRQRLAPLVPDVVGLNPPDERTGAWIARLSALGALSVASDARQGVAVVGLFHCERLLNLVEGHPQGHLSPVTALALEQAPHAHEWAVHFVAHMGDPHTGDFDRQAAPAIVANSVRSIVDSDALTGEAEAIGLLTRTIAACRSWMGQRVGEECVVTRPEWDPDRTTREPVPQRVGLG